MRFEKAMVLLAVLVAVIGILIAISRARHGNEHSVPIAQPGERAISSHWSSRKTGVRPEFLSEPMSEPEREASGDRSHLIALPGLPRETIEAYLNRHGRTAATLLAAYHSSIWTNAPLDYLYTPVGDASYLREAATKFPGDPRVQCAVLIDPLLKDALLNQNASFVEARKWLEAFKAAAPDNAFPDYLSAQAWFWQKNTSEFLGEIAAAEGKTGFDNFASQYRSDIEQLYLEAGKTPKEAAYAATVSQVTDSYVGMSSLSGMAFELSELQNTYRDAGDTDSAKRIAELGLAFAGRLDTEDANNLLVGKLSGLSKQMPLLSNLDQNQSYDFLNGRTPAERLQELRQEIDSLKQLAKFGAETCRSLTDDEWAAFYRQWDLHGQTAAIRWLQQQRGNNRETGGPP
jgi:hypothetical protein